MLKLTVRSVEGSRTLEELVPFDINLLRTLPGPDRPDYWLGEVVRPLCFVLNRRRVDFTYAVLAEKAKGGHIEAGARNVPIALAYITDIAQLGAREVNFGQCRYFAIAMTDETSTSLS